MLSLIRMQLFLSLCAVTVAWGQQSSTTNTPSSVIQGHGTQHTVAKFTGTNSIGDSAIVEVGGNLSTTDDIAATIDRKPGIAVQGTNATTKGSKKLDAAPSSGIGGVVGTTNSPAGIGVYGVSTASDGDPIGVLGTTSSTLRGVAIRGQAQASSGQGIGVLGGGVIPMDSE